VSSWGSSPTPEAPTPAATVIPLRDGLDGLEVLMLRRSSRGAFGGMWVFPGGKVDPADVIGEPDVIAGPDPDGAAEQAEQAEQAEEAELAAARRAAVREAREEAGIEIDPAGLVVLSFWLPPPEAPRRFATWFFLAPPTAAREVVVDEFEIHEHRWVTPRAAMNLRDAGEWELAPPTFTTLWWLAEQADSANALAVAAATPPGRFETHVAMDTEGRFGATLWAGDAGYEDRDLYRPGPRRRLVMDPAGWRVEISP
jgi:8-oxo-dGTP pyrophosphatase MutT (NUDIX family)